MQNATTNDKCIGCKHQEQHDNQWCYMFKDAPETLPCGQHDKYAEQRKATGKLIQKNPIFIMGLLDI